VQWALETGHHRSWIPIHPITLAEECDITIRLLRRQVIGYKQPKAIAYTEVREMFKMFLRQRFAGILELCNASGNIAIHIFNAPIQVVRMGVPCPTILVFQLFLPFIAPLADLVTIMGIYLGNGFTVFNIIIVFLMVEMITAAIAFSFEGESKKTPYLAYTPTFLLQTNNVLCGHQVYCTSNKRRISHLGNT